MKVYMKTYEDLFGITKLSEMHDKVIEVSEIYGSKVNWCIWLTVFKYEKKEVVYLFRHFQAIMKDSSE